MPSLCLYTAGANDLTRQSAARHNITLHEYLPNPRGFIEGKTRDGITFLENRDEEYAMWIDGPDTLVLKPEQDILARIPKEGVLIASERTCWPDQTLTARYPQVSHAVPRFLNAGGYCGRRADLITVLKLVLANAVDQDDQRAWTRTYLGQWDALAKKRPQILIDRARRVFCSMGDHDAKDCDPCTRHWNGRSPGRDEWWRRYVCKG